MAWKLALPKDTPKPDQSSQAQPGGLLLTDGKPANPWVSALSPDRLREEEERSKYGGYTLAELDTIMQEPAMWGRLHGKVEHRLTKEAVPWHPTLLQRRMIQHYVWCRDRNLPCRMIVLKIRRGGGSTGASALVYIHLHTHPSRAGVIGTDYEVSSNLMKMVKFFDSRDDFPGWHRAKKVIDDELKWENGSTLQRYTAENPEASRSAGLQAYHASELARWQDSAAISSKETLRSLRGSVPRHGFTLGIEESTAQGSTGSFAETFARGRWPEYAVWPDPWREETPDGEMEFGEDLQHTRIFAAWFEDAEARVEITPEQQARVQSTMNKIERDLIARYLRPGPRGDRLGSEVDATVWEQLAWRRMVVAAEFDGDEEAFDQENPCIVAGERVGTSVGIVPIEQVAEGVISDHGAVAARISKGIKPCCEVVTKLGYKVRCTYDHRIRLANGDFMAAAGTMGMQIRLQPPVFATDYHVERWTGFCQIEHALKIDEDFGRFLGYFMGDGCYHGATISFVCTRKDEDVVADTIRLVTKYFGAPGIRHQTSGGTEIRVARSEAKAFFDRLGMLRYTVRKDRDEQVHHRRVCVPECIWRSPISVVREFLRGLFEADGWTSGTKNSAKFFTKYEDFSRDVQLLLLGFGIHCCRRKVVSGSGFPGYELTLWSIDARRFHETIGFISERKTNRLRDARLKPGGRPPVDIAMQDEVVLIASIGEQPVFDLVIDGEPMFGASGILVHNCSPAKAFASSGRHTFHRGGVALMASQAPQDRQFGILSTQHGGEVVFTATQPMDGWLELYQEPREGFRYIIGVDCMTGAEQLKNSGVSDWNAALVLRAPYIDEHGVKQPMLVVASLRAKNDDNMDVLFDQVNALSKYYGRCMVVPEVNGPGYGFLALAKQAGMNLFRRQDYDKVTQEFTDHAGWKTDPKSRPQIITALQIAIRSNAQEGRRGEGLLCPNKTACTEAAGMARDPDGIDRGKPHDDHIIALGIAVVNVSAATYYAGKRRKRHDPADMDAWRQSRR